MRNFLAGLAVGMTVACGGWCVMEQKWKSPSVKKLLRELLG